MVIAPLAQAWRRTILICFRPFQIGKWFTLGFCAWLSTLFEGGSTPNFDTRGGGGPGGGPAFPTWPEIRAWIEAHIAPMAVFLWLVVGALIILIALYIVILWIRARGKFMFLDGVAFNRGLVIQPWKEFRPQGNSLFRFSLLYFLATSCMALTCGGTALLILWPVMNGREFTPATLGQLAIAGLIAAPIAIMLFLISTTVETLIVPIMYHQRITVTAAWQVFRQRILPGHFWWIILLYLMYMALGIGMVIALEIIGCVTCCLGFILMIIPYINAVFLLPFIVFFRSYSVYFLEQFGNEFRIFPDLTPPPNYGFPVTLDGPPQSPPDSTDPPMWP